MTPQLHSQVYNPKELKTSTQTSKCTDMLTAALFTIAKGGNGPNVYQLING